MDTHIYQMFSVAVSFLRILGARLFLTPRDNALARATRCQILSTYRLLAAQRGT